jgi:hypothetical protein
VKDCGKAVAALIAVFPFVTRDPIQAMLIVD